MPPAARVLPAAVLGVGRKIGVAGAQKAGGLGVVAAAGVLVADQQRDGGAGGVAPVHAGKKLHFVRLGTRGGKPVPAGAAAVHGGGDGRLVHRQPGGQAVQHGAHGGAVALAKDRQADGVAKGVFHASGPFTKGAKCARRPALAGRRKALQASRPSRAGSSPAGSVSARQQPSPGHLMTVILPPRIFLSCCICCSTFSLLPPMRVGRPSVR